jgi:CHASE2 domain-containing sensor protein
MNTSTPMTTITLAVGAGLTVLGIAGYALTGAASPTALIPTLVGLLVGTGTPSMRRSRSPCSARSAR